VDGRRHAAQTYLPEPREQRRGTALCLSGGGYRAALFHLGVLRRLEELGTLARVDTISAVSGGSILAGFIANRIRPWPESGRIPEFATAIVPAFRRFTEKNIRTLWVLRRALPWNWRDPTVAVESLAARYEKDIVQLTLGQLPRRPRFIFNATELTFGTNWVSEREQVGSYMPGYVTPPPEWPVARAVAASSCFPPAFEPMPTRLEPRLFAGGRLGDDAPDRDGLLERMQLTDGGVYDNMALEAVWKDHAVLLVSDGGATFDRRSPAPLWRPFAYLGRFLDVQGNQARALRRRWLVASFLREEMRGVYLGIGSDVSRFDGGAGYSAALVAEVIAAVRTDLDHFSDAEAAVLQNHGYTLADAAMRVHGQAWCDDEAPPARIPHPEWMDEVRVRAAMRSSDRRRLLGRWRWAPLSGS
jgi:NTE family protein